MRKDIELADKAAEWGKSGGKVCIMRRKEFVKLLRERH